MAQDINQIPEAVKLLAIIETNLAFRNKYGWKGSTEFKNAVAKITAGANASKNPIAFLTNILGKYDPGYKTLKPNAKVEPGKLYAVSEPNIPIGSLGAKYLPSPEKIARLKVLQDKIDAHNLEIERLHRAYLAANKAAAQAEAEHNKIKPIFDEKTLKYFAYIEANCGEYLKAVRETGKVLYRGQHESKSPIFVGYPREDRRPKDSDGEAQKLYDKYLTIMGFKALRSNSIFTSSSEKQAGDYGEIYAIFPKDGFSFTWSTKESDLVLNKVSQVTKNHIGPEEIFYEYVDDLESLDNYLEDFIHYRNDYKDERMALKKSPAVKDFKSKYNKWGDLDYWRDSSQKMYDGALAVAAAYLEICKLYPIVKSKMPKKFTQASNVIKNIQKKTGKASINSEKENAEKMVKSYRLLDTNLVAALKSQHEVCVLGEYVAVSVDVYRKQINQYFLTKERPVVPKKSAVKKPTAKKKPALKLFPDYEPAELGGKVSKKLAGNTKGFKT